MPKRSEIWDHFSVEVTKQRAKCDYCEKIVCISGGGTGNLIRHLRLRHPDLELSTTKRSKKRITVKKRSEIWEHFSKASDGRARCHYCQRNLSYSGGGSGNLSRHIRLQHRDILDDSLETPYESVVDEQLSDNEPDVNEKEPINSKPPSSKRSEVWKHFSSVSNGRAKCCYCLKSISFLGGGPANLTRHMRTKHKEIPLGSIKKEIDPESLISIESELPENKLIDTSENASFPTTSLIASPPKRIQVLEPERKPIPMSHSKKLDEQLMKTIVKQYYPVKMVEDPDFKKLVHMLSPNYEVPTRKTVCESLIPRMYNEVKKKVENMLIGVEAVCITIERWTSITEQSYIDVTAHFLGNIDSEIALQSCFLQCIPYDSSHTSASLGTLLRSEVEYWIPAEKVVCAVTDNDPNIVDAVKFNNWEHLPCFAYTLNLVLREGITIVEEEIAKVREIVAYFRRNSTAMHLLMQEQFNFPQIKLKEDYITKWISTYEMISRAIQVKDAIVAALEIDNPELNYISDREWKVLEATLEIFKVFDIVIKEISAEKYLPLSKIMLFINAINTHLIKMSLENTFDEITAIIAILQNSISQRFKDIESNELVATATILDPRFKRYGFTSQTNFERSLRNFKRKVPSSPSPIVSQNTTESQPETSLIWEDFDIRVQNVIASTNTCPASANEVDKYLNEPVIRRTEDPLKWWDERKHIYPILYKMVPQTFCIVGTSVSSEKVFSKAGLATDERRSCLKAENASECLFLHHNL